MPNKDIQKRREAYQKWALNNKEKRRNYQRILWISKKKNPVPQKCTVAGCKEIGERHHPDYSKPDEIIWICRSHHRTTQHSGKCRICDGRVLALELCNKHYKSERKRIDPVYALKEKLQKKKKSLPTV